MKLILHDVVLPLPLPLSLRTRTEKSNKESPGLTKERQGYRNVSKLRFSRYTVNRLKVQPSTSEYSLTILHRAAY